MADSRTRNWCFLIYPGDSAPDNWLSILQSYHVPMCISPLHFPDDEEFKPHRHVEVMYSNVKTQAQAQEISDSVNGSICFRIEDIGGYSRYLCHLDEEDNGKTKYDINEVISLSGANYHALIEKPSRMMEAIPEILDFIEEHDIYSYSRLVRWCRKYNQLWWEVITRMATYFLVNYLKARQWEREHPDIAQLDDLDEFSIEVAKND